MLPPSDPAGGDEARAVIDALVTVALDDLDEGHLDIETALRAIAMATWTAGRAASPAP